MGAQVRVVEGPGVGGTAALDDEILIGRSGAQASLFAQDTEISRNHARITVTAQGALVLEDLGSTNGTYLNGWRIPSPQLLSSGDRVQTGATVLEVDAADGLAGRAPAILSGVHGYEELRPEARTSVLYVDGLKKYYGEKHVLEGLDLEIQPGEIVGLLGPNGAGKTTFVSIVAGLRPATAGSVQVLGKDAFADPREARRHMGLAPQDLGLYPTQSVRTNLEFFGEMHGLTGSLLKQRVQDTAEALSLDPMFDQTAGTLSGGQKRRLHTAMAMLHEPKLLMLDEPTVGADIRTRQEILDVVKRLGSEGKSICYSTHYLPEIEELGASVAILKGGQIIARGSIADLIANHSSPYVEVTFDGEPPNLQLRGEITRRDNVLRVKTSDPSGVAATIVNQLGADVSRVRDIEVINGNLDSVYLTLTEERYSSMQPVPDEITGAAA